MGALVPPDVHRVELDSGYVVGSVNAWLLDAEPFTLVDAGAAFTGASERLDAACAAIGRRVEDLEQVLLTHHHVDHVGLAAHVVGRSGASVTALAPVATHLEDFPRQMTLDGDFAGAALRTHGFPEAEARGVRDGHAGQTDWAGAVPVDRRLASGERLDAGGGSFRVLHRPGHSETDTVLVDEARGLVISGDHLMRDHASMPMIDRPLGVVDGFAEEARRCDRLVAYRRSLRASLEDLDGVVLPGHGEAFDAPREVVARHLLHHDAQGEQVLAALADGAPASGFAVAERLWPRTALRWPFLSACTVLALLGWLDDEGRVEAGTDDEGRVRYRATGR